MTTALDDTTIPMPKWNDLEIDKIPGAWVVTWWLPDDVTLRLKVLRSSSLDPEDFVAQVRLKCDEEFQTVHQFMEAVYSILNPDEWPAVWDDLPQVWTEHFKLMLKVWARLVDIAEFGCSLRDRYGSEPISSIDHFEQEVRRRNEALQNEEELNHD